eukprot:399310-Prymnesium_polylepis.1
MLRDGDACVVAWRVEGVVAWRACCHPQPHTVTLRALHCAAPTRSEPPPSPQTASRVRTDAAA